MPVREVQELVGNNWVGFRKNRQVPRDEWWSQIPPRPTFDKEVKYMEDETIIMPLMEDGVVALGDLYNIRTNKTVGVNLFHYNKLTTDHLVAHPRKDLEYRFDHIGDTMDYLNTLKVEASVTVDVLFSGGNVHVYGRALFDQIVSRKFYEHEIKCSYRNDSFSVQLLPINITEAGNAINRDAYDKLLTGKLEATHIVAEIILGGETQANLYIKTDDQKDHMRIEGNLVVKVEVGGVKVDARATVEMVKNDTSDHLDKRIYVYSKPPFAEQPNDVPAMLKCLDDLPKRVAEEKHFPMFKGEVGEERPVVTGVPLRFKLVPLEKLLELPASAVRKSFKVISPAVLNEFIIMLATLKDFQSNEYVKRKILERDNRLLTLLKDQDNPLTIEISEWERELNSEAVIIQHVADAAYKKYKEDENASEDADLKVVIDLFKEKLNMVEFGAKLENYRRLCKKEIVGIHFSDVDEEVDITFLSNEIDVDDWYGSERRTKILLHTNTDSGQSPTGTFLNLFNISKHLKSLGADVGVVYPSISTGFKLHIKTNAVETIYYGADIPYAMSILGMAVGKGEIVPTLFWTVNGALTGIRLPLHDNISDIPSLIAVNKELQDVNVCPTYLTMREAIAKQDGRVKIVLETQALESVADSIVFFRRLRAELQKEPPMIPVDWVVGTFDLTKFHDAPLAFVFLDGTLLSVCLDNLDILMLLEQLRSEKPDFDLLQAEKVKKNCLYPKRGDFALQVAELLGQYHGSMTDKVEELASFARPVEVYEYLDESNINDAMFVNRELISGYDMRVVAAIATICIRIFPQMLSNLKQMGWNEASAAFQQGLTASSWLRVADYLKKFLENENPFLAKVEYLRTKIEEVLEANEKSDEPLDLTEIIDSINVIIDHEDPLCPPDLKSELQSYNDAKPEMKIKGYHTSLSKYAEEQFADEKYFSLRHLMKFVSILIDNDGQLVGTTVPDTVALFIERVLTDETLKLFPGADKKLKEYLDKKNYFQTLSLMSKIQYDHNLFMVHQCLYLLHDISDADLIKTLVDKMGKNEFTLENYGDLWRNNKFAYYMLKGLQSQGVLEAIMTYQCTEGVVPDHIPLEFEEKLVPMLLADDDLKFEWKQKWETVEEALKVFQAITVRKVIPKEFPDKLRENIDTNSSLQGHFVNANVLYYWDFERKLFTQPWDLPTIAKVVEKLITYIKSGPYIESQHPNFVRNSTSTEIPVIEEQKSSESELRVKEEWKIIAEDIVPKPDISDYHTLQNILESPVINFRKLETAMERILPYVIQRVKLLSNDPLRPEKVYNYIKYPEPLNVSIPGIIDFGDGEDEQEKLPLVSRGDILTYLVNSREPNVVKNVLQLLGKFPMALPLNVQDIENSSPTKQFKLLHQQLKNIPIRWEVTPEEIVENNLFADPYRMTVVVRLGDLNPGKSPILNSVMANPRNIFSSVKDSQSDLERPISHPGLVELTWLTKQTCKNTFWRKLVDTHYSKTHAARSNEVLLLANLHGDAMENHKVALELKELGARFLVMLMPDTWENLKEKAKKFTSLLGATDVMYALVDPMETLDPEKVSTASVLFTGDILENKTEVLELLLLKSFDSRPFRLTDHVHQFDGLQETETPQSRHLVNLVKRYTCKTVRQILKLHNLDQYNNMEFWNMYEDNEDLQTLMNAFRDILTLSPYKRDSSLSHVKQELDILSADSSMKTRLECLQLIDELRDSVDVEIPILDEIRNLHNQIKGSKVWIDERTLGVEHFFRELGRLYESQVFNGSGPYADHIIKGNEVEIFNRDAGDIFWGRWLKQVLHEQMPEGFENKRVFVVSIVGLISSGKSTLLNALFGCKFSVSIGGGTKGIFMKLLFLEENLREELKVDIIILLDTQGVSTIGGVGDVETLQKEQQMISLTLGLSNLTILNTKGRKLGNMASVLESVFAKLTAVEELKFLPDFLLVHHQSGHRSIQAELIIMELTTALRTVSTLTDNNELALGVRERIGRRLNKIMRRVKHNDIVHTVSPHFTGINNTTAPSKLFHADVVALYEKILMTCKEADTILTFGEWYRFSEDLWKNLTCHQDNFPLRFSNSVQIQDYINLVTQKIVTVKDLIDWAFLSHTEELQEIIDQIDIKEIVMLSEEGVLLTGREARRKAALLKLSKKLRKMAGTCERTFPDGITVPCKLCTDALVAKEALLTELKGSNFRFETEEKLNDYIVDVRNSLWNRLTQSLLAFEIATEDEEAEEDVKWKTLSPEYNEALAKLEDDPERWRKIQQLFFPKATVIPADTQIKNEVAQYYKNLPHLISRVEYDQELPQLGSIKAFDLGYYNAIQVFELVVPEEEESSNKGDNETEQPGEGGGDETDCGCKVDKEQSEYLDWAQKDWIEAQIKDVPELMWQSRCYDPKTKQAKWVYEVGMIRDFQTRVNKILAEFEQRNGEKILPNFKWETHIYGILYFISYMNGKQQEWNTTNHPVKVMPGDITVPFPGHKPEPIDGKD